MGEYRLKKEERIKSKKLSDYIFNGGAKSFSNFPIRIVYKEDPNPSGNRVKILVSVSKKRFKHAVDRNRVKRLMRESYRLNKAEIQKYAEEKNQYLAISFIYLSNSIKPFEVIEEKMKTLLHMVTEEDYRNEEVIG